MTPIPPRCKCGQPAARRLIAGGRVQFFCIPCFWDGVRAALGAHGAARFEMVEEMEKVK